MSPVLRISQTMKFISKTPSSNSSTHTKLNYILGHFSMIYSNIGSHIFIFYSNNLYWFRSYKNSGVYSIICYFKRHIQCIFGALEPSVAPDSLKYSGAQSANKLPFFWLDGAETFNLMLENGFWAASLQLSNTSGTEVSHSLAFSS